jgi:glycosyltransferase involved in cell wall biosynthesis
MKLSIVVPVFNEQSSLKELVNRISSVVERENYSMELLLIDDGSTDGSWVQIEGLCGQYNWIRAVRLRRNFGKAAALAAGFERTVGTCVVTMDADLQDDPDEIPHLLNQLQNGSDVVSGWKKDRHDPWHKVIPSRVFNWLISKLTGVRLHDHNCGLKAYRSEVLKEIQLYGEMHRFIPVLAAARGFRVSEIVVHHRARKFGQSKYGLERFIKGFLDLMTVYFLTGYGNRPQHLLGTLGLSSFVTGSLGLLGLSAWWLVSRCWDDIQVVHLHQKAIFYFFILAVLLGIQVISIGFLAELITALVRPSRSPFSVAEEIGAGEQNLNSHSKTGGKE